MDFVSPRSGTDAFLRLRNGSDDQQTSESGFWTVNAGSDSLGVSQEMERSY